MATQSANESQKADKLNDEHKENDIAFSDDEDDGYASSSISDTTAPSYSYQRFGDSNQSKRLMEECMRLRKAKARFEVSKDGKSVTFYPSESAGIKQETKALQTEEFLGSNRFKEIMKNLQCSKIEHIFSESMQIVKNASYINPFAAAAEYAFYKHYPLAIKPSDLWLLVLQSTAIHLSQNAEKLREKFVKHDGKKKLIIERPNFVKGGKNNDWDGVVSEFVEQIDKNTVGDVVKLFEPDFTSSTFMDRIAARVTTMDILQEYFEYEMMCGCGFPQITLNGTKNDWIKLKKKTKQLLKDKVVPKFGKKWSNAIMGVLQRFIDAYDGKIDCLFWNSMVRRGAYGGSGMRMLPEPGTPIKGVYAGWLNVFFPYDENRKDQHRAMFMSNDKNKEKVKPSKPVEVEWNKYCVPYSKKASYVLEGYTNMNFNGMYAERFPLGIGSAPVLYEDAMTGKSYDLKFVSGFLGIEQDKKTLELSTKVGWFVAEK